MTKDYKILLYYKFTKIHNPKEYTNTHLELCKRLNLKGRILIASEGINGTCSGLTSDTEKYIAELRQDPRFSDMVFKIDDSDTHAFNKLHVKFKSSVLTLLDEDEVDPNKKVGQYLKPKDFYEMLQRDDVIIVDGRNDYEYEIGHFRGAIKPNVKNFKQFPKWIDDNLSDYKDKKILSYCTGGIRCEKLTSVLLEKGFSDVYHLDGGIVTYGKDDEVKGKLWYGKCYVFDNRISTQINRTEEDIVISKCSLCNESSDRYINCRNDDCHDQFLCCQKCEETFSGFCSTKCKDYIIKRPDRDARLRIIERKKLYERYNQNITL